MGGRGDKEGEKSWHAFTMIHGGRKWTGLENVVQHAWVTSIRSRGSIEGEGEWVVTHL